MKLSLELFNILLLLLPGLIASQVFYNIDKTLNITAAKRIYDSIIYSFIILLIISLFTAWEPILQLDKTDKGLNYIISGKTTVIFLNIVLMIITPVILGAISHHDLFHKILRKIKLTTKTSRSNTWNDTFITEDRHIIVYLKDERRIRGYPEKFSDDPDEGFIYLYQPAWINDDKEKDTDPNYIELNTHGMLLHRDIIDMIEFTYNTNESPQQLGSDYGK